MGTAPHTPGRSRWPEPEGIRRATGARFRKHARLASIPDDVYPRAEFGLPIIFHFKDNDKGEPPDTELVPLVNGQPRQRMASPLILRPLVLDSRKAVPMALLLKAPPLYNAALNQVKPSRHIEDRAIRDARAAAYPNSPLGPEKAGALPRSACGSALEAFLAYLCERGLKRAF